MNRRLDRRLLALAAAYAVALDTPLPGFHRHFAAGGERRDRPGGDLLRRRTRFGCRRQRSGKTPTVLSLRAPS
jgi:hypothetical protein